MPAFAVESVFMYEGTKRPTRPSEAFQIKEFAESNTVLIENKMLQFAPISLQFIKN
jgi:hypothetical protein